MDNFNNSFKYSALILKSLKDELSADEQQVLTVWLEEDPGHQQLYDQLSDAHFVSAELELYLSFDKDEVRGRLLEQVAPKVKTVKLWPKIAGVAAAVATILIGAWFFYIPLSGNKNQDLLAYANDIAPGHNGATLTLANGEVIELSDAKNGVVVGEDLTYNDGSAVSSTLSGNGNPLSPQGGSLPEGERRGGNLSPSGRDAEGREGNRQGNKEHNRQFNKTLTATTAKGQTYQITLPDGTKVWLNADSKLTFPSSFDKANNRVVALTGEAYFAVVHNGKQPFLVQSKGQIVEDIGTEFNINAYEVNVKTTLVEGSARVNEVVLQPNQQSATDGGAIKVTTVNTASFTAWKEGQFRFSEEPLENIMKQLSRWYSIEVSYESAALKKERFGGFISRSSNISAVLRMLEQTGQVKFSISGNKVVVK